VAGQGKTRRADRAGRGRRVEPWTTGSEGAGRDVPGEDARHAVHHREGHALNIRAVPAEHHGIGRGVPHDLPRPAHRRRSTP